MPITLTVEDGTRPTGANTYAALADANAYWADRGSATWEDATDDEKSSALIQATDYLNGLTWTGRKVAIRTMAWPRTDVEVDGYSLGSDEIPDEVVHATCYMAGEIIGGADPLAVQDRQINEMSVGSVSIKYDQSSPQSPTFPAIQAMLKALLWGSNTIRLVRA